MKNNSYYPSNRPVYCGWNRHTRKHWLTTRSYFILLLSLFLSSGTQAQKPKAGTYTFAVAFAEWNGRSLGATCTVVVRGDSVVVLHNGTGGLSGKRGDVLDKGILMKHARTGQWIIAHASRDRHAPEVGGCSDGPAVLDFRRKKYSIC